MKAVVLTGHGGLDKLEFHRDWPKPVILDHEVLIRVEACGLNNTDVNTRSAWYSKSVTGATTGDALQSAQDADGGWDGTSIQFPRIQGADVAGVVESAGSSVPADLIGKRVMIDPCLRDWNAPLNLDLCTYYGSECDGGFAEYTKVDYHNVHPIESSLSSAELATFATAYNTAENMLHRAGVTHTDTVIITGASGGVGSALIQLANRRGATTIAICSERKADLVAAIGPDVIIPRTDSDLSSMLQMTIGNIPITVAADVVGGKGFNPHISQI